METADEVEILIEENAQDTSNLTAVRAGAERAAAIRRRHAIQQARDSGVAAAGDRTTFFIRDMMIRLPHAADVPPRRASGGLASTFLRVAHEADRDVRAQPTVGERRRQYPAGAMPDRSPLKRRKKGPLLRGSSRSLSV